MLFNLQMMNSRLEEDRDRRVIEEMIKKQGVRLS